MPPKNETPKTKVDKVKAFSDLAGKRTQKVLDSITVLENCANKNTYTYTPAQADRIVSEVAKAVSRLQASFAAGGKAKSGERFQV